MTHDPRYLRQNPVGAMTLFFDGRGAAAAVLAACALLLHTWLAWDAMQVDRFNTNAQQATAKVTRITGDEALVTYHTPQGSFAQRIQGQRLQEGDKVRIYYTPNSPTVIRRALRDDLPLTGWFQGIATMLGLIGLWVGWGQGMRTVRALQTRRYGTIEQVTVTRIEEGNIGRHSNTPPARLHWKRSDGTFGTSRWHNLAHASQWAPGDQTDIYVWRDQTHWRDDLGPRPYRKTHIPRVTSSGQDAPGS